MLVLGFGCGHGIGPGGLPPGGGGPDQPGLPPGGGDSEQTGLQGTVRRGPIRPVCQVDQPCDAPFSARFGVQQGGQVVAHFQSDSDGRFVVHLAPGTYTIVPDASVPLPMRGQVQEVTVGPSGVTQVELDFDTGIR